MPNTVSVPHTKRVTGVEDNPGSQSGQDERAEKMEADRLRPAAAEQCGDAPRHAAKRAGQAGDQAERAEDPTCWLVWIGGGAYAERADRDGHAGQGVKHLTHSGGDGGLRFFAQAEKVYVGGGGSGVDDGDGDQQAEAAKQGAGDDKAKLQQKEAEQHAEMAL